MKFIKNKVFIFWFVSVVAAFLIGGFIDANFVNRPFNSSPNVPSLPSFLGSVSEFHAGTQSQYKLINPLYECNTGQPYGTKELSDLRSNVAGYIDQLTANNSVTRVSVWFRDLNTGPWFGINEHDNFSPSSLLKTPVMMAYYLEAEKDPTILNKQITYTSDPYPILPQHYPAQNPIQKGKTYTIEDLISRMIMNSDNAALGLLEQNISNDKINQVTLDLGITTATNSTPEDYMDVNEYSTLFRVLYYSTYLNKDYSEKALELLSKSEFNKGLVAPLPKNITVAHKFGERQLEDGSNQLHDCGIVYYPKHPYLLCVMTKGAKFDDLSSTIQQISAKVYSEASKMYR